MDRHQDRESRLRVGKYRRRAKQKKKLLSQKTDRAMKLFIFLEFEQKDVGERSEKKPYDLVSYIVKFSSTGNNYQRVKLCL